MPAPTEKIQPKLAQKGDSAITAQMKKLFKHTRTGSFQTRKRYEKACKTFTNFLNERFKMKNLRNLQDKHLVAYIEHRQSLGIADKTIKTDLGAIRYMHDFIPNAKYELSSNVELKQLYNIQLEQTKAVRGDRAWKTTEICLAYILCEMLVGPHTHQAKHINTPNVKKTLFFLKHQ